MRISLQPAFILHHRPFRETSVLLDVFSKEHGRVSLIAKGVRTSRSKLKALLQPFVPLLVSWQGKNELMNLVSAEANGPPFQLCGDCLLSGFYINELLVRVLQKQDPHPHLFAHYVSTLKALTALPLNQGILRIFEKKLLEEMGYGLRWNEDFSTGHPLIPDQYYQYYPGEGFKHIDNQQAGSFKGESLLAFAHELLTTHAFLQDAKRLMRIVISTLLGNQPLQSRELFQK
jgi:DNA repair protein RecO (recombination protein O)